MTPPSFENVPPSLLGILAGRLLQGVSLLLIGLTALGLVLTVWILAQESAWLPPPVIKDSEEAQKRNEQAFFHGTIGTEVAPLPVIQILPELFPEHFRPFPQAEAGDWQRQFGFIPSARVPIAHPAGENLEGVPLGFTLSHYRPRSGAPSPAKFVGLACATCHTTLIRRTDGKDHLAIGVGNTALNLFAWLDAFQAALLDEEKLTMASIVSTYEAKSPPLSLEQKAIIALWLSGARAKLNADAQKYDLPYGNGLPFRNADLVPTGPGRTQPFRTLVRSVLHRPGATMKVYTKVATVYWQDLENGWGQFDGGIRGLHRRSSGAAFAAGATVQNMNLPEIADNIIWASDYLKLLKGPQWADVFPDRPIDADKAARGKQVYLTHCNACHGHPKNDTWVKGNRLGELTLLAEIKTDPERVTFRYYEQLPDVLATLFPKQHRFDFPRDELQPAPGDPKRGYINKPLHSVFSRAPYLHNASVLSLKALINLEDRQKVFIRGHNTYDPETLGLSAPTDHKADDYRLYFRYDTGVPGNSNAGHDYPWPREDVLKDTAKQRDLGDLLEYLKTF